MVVANNGYRDCHRDGEMNLDRFMAQNLQKTSWFHMATGFTWVIPCLLVGTLSRVSTLSDTVVGPGSPCKDTKWPTGLFWEIFTPFPERS